MKRWIVGIILASSALFAMSLGQLNKASKEELMQIKGIGEKKAAAIIKARKKGKFTSYDDLVQRVPGIGEQTAENIKRGVKNSETSKASSRKKSKTSAKKKTKKIEKKSNKKSKSAKSKKLKKETSKGKKKSKKAA